MPAVLELGGDLLAELELLDLGAGHRPLVDETDVPRHLERRDAAEAEVDQLLLAGLVAGPELDEAAATSV